MNEVVFVFGLVLVIWITVIVMMEGRGRALLRRLAAEREGYRKEDFVRELHERGVSPRIATAVWDTVRNEISIPALPLKPDDSLVDMFGIIEEDLEELTTRALTAAGFGQHQVACEEISSVEDLCQAISRVEGRAK